MLSQQQKPIKGFGLGLRASHYRDFLELRPLVDWIEVHTENYFGKGGWDLHVLETLRPDYPLSLHGVGLGLGSASDEYFEQHLEKVSKVSRRFEPALISEHLSWAVVGGRHMNDLLPMPLTSEAMQLVCERVDRAQQKLGKILLENISAHLRFAGDTYLETEFLDEVAERTGCEILLDINNLFVNEMNHQENAHEAMMVVDPSVVGEIHLAGHLVTEYTVIDHHGSPVSDTVWDLYRHYITRNGEVPTLIEWDNNIPALSVLLEEVQMARKVARQSLECEVYYV